VTKSEKSATRKHCRKRYNNRCALTGREGCEVHHIIPLEYGGTWDDDNLILLNIGIHKLVHSSNVFDHKEFQRLPPDVQREILKLQRIIFKARRS